MKNKVLVKDYGKEEYYETARFLCKGDAVLYFDRLVKTMNNPECYLTSVRLMEGKNIIMRRDKNDR